MKTILITGANRGLGLEIVKGIASPDTHIILACRDPQKGLDAIVGLPGSFDVVTLDVTQPASIQACYQSLRSRYTHLDVLINNAGIYTNHAQTIPFLGQALSVGWVTNALGPYVLTQTLRPLLDASKNPTCIFMCSMAGHKQTLDLQTLNGSKPKAVYGQSKYADLLLCEYFASHCPDWCVLGVHPGYANTEIFNGLNPGTWRDIVRLATRFMAQSPKMGALPAIKAVRERFPSRTYLVPKYLGELYGPPTMKTITPYFKMQDYTAFVAYLDTLAF